MKKVIIFILLTVFSVIIFPKNLVFKHENILKNVNFVDNSTIDDKLKVQKINIQEDYTPLFIKNEIFNFPNSITGERVSYFNDFLFFFNCGIRPGKESQIILFDSKNKSILTKTIKPGQGPFNLDYIGNCFFINKHTVALIYTFKVITFDFSNGEFKEYFSQRFPVYNSTYTSAKMLNWKNQLVLFNFSFQPYKGKIPWFFKYDISKKSIKLSKTSFLNEYNLKKIAGKIWDLNNSDIDKSSIKYFELWPKPTDIKVFIGEKEGDYYFCNPISGVLLKGNCLNNKIDAYTTFKLNTNSTFNDIFFNKFSNEVWVVCNSKKSNPQIIVLSKHLKYKYTVEINIENKFKHFNIYKLIMLNDKEAIAICAIEKKKVQGFTYNIIKIGFKNL